jgi:hypothetical protein
MSENVGLNKKLSSTIEIEFPDFTKLPERVKQKFDSLPTKVNFFRMLGYSPGTFVEVIDLTNAIFKKPDIIRLPQRTFCAAGGCANRQ